MSGFFPSDALIVDAETDLLTAEASAVDGLPALGGPDDQKPIGRTWHFDFRAGRFARRGTGPAELRDEAAVAMWIETVLRIGRYAHGIFSDAYGLEDPEDPIGLIVTPALLADLADRMKRAILVHDRITSVDDVLLRVDGDAIVLDNLTAVYDETNSVQIQGVQLT